MEEEELLELTRVYRRRMDEIYTPTPQLKARRVSGGEDEDRAFRV